MVINPVLALQALVLFVAGGWFSALLGVAVVKVSQFVRACARTHVRSGDGGRDVPCVCVCVRCSRVRTHCSRLVVPAEVAVVR